MNESISKTMRKRPHVAPQVAPEILPNFESTNEPWSHILTSINYSNLEPVYITADDIKKAGKTWNGKASQFEPRLLAYQTSSNSRPNVFKKNNIYILPIKNGTYLITPINIYKELIYSGSDNNSDIIHISKDTSSFVLNIGQSETSVIDNLRYSGVFERPELLGEYITHGPLLNGRHRCDINLTLDEKEIEIRGVQYEVDACFESKNKILIIEGKSSNKEIDSFNIRQLFFPYRVINDLIDRKKEINCLFIHELNSIINIWKFEFTNVMAMDSIKLVGYYRYKFTN